jgi:GH24 family phage-related lysozyme (muramidase)
MQKLEELEQLQHKWGTFKPNNYHKNNMDDKPNNLNVIEFAIKRVNDKNEKSLNNAIESFKQTIRDAEGLELEAYKPDEDEEQFTIGYGRYGVEEGMTITEEEAEEFLDEDVRERLDSIVDLLPQFNSYPNDLQQAIFSEHYRGSIQQSPKTRELINSGDFDEAAIEFLDNEEYEEAEERGIPGIRPRMEKVSELLKKYAK